MTAPCFNGCRYGSNMIGIRMGRRVDSKPSFSGEIIERSWRILKEHMTANQYFAFMENGVIEIQSVNQNYRLLLSKTGDFILLQGKKGMGIEATNGRIEEHNYPLGDEIAVFIDWFRYKPKELIAQWNCGIYGIVKEGKRRVSV